MMKEKPTTSKLNRTHKQKVRSPREGTRIRSTHSHSLESHKNMNLEAIIYKKRICRVKREKQKYIYK